MIAQGFLTDAAADYLREAVCSRQTIFLCGGTGSGKTTFLNTLSSFIPKDERVVTIEDSQNCRCRFSRSVRLEARLPGPTAT
jgi:pilus assembly protein CpaF